MTLTLLLPWFPIMLAVGVVGRLLGRGRGFAIGLVCALFWIVLVQASAGIGLWRQPWAVVTIVMGGAAIFLIGGWASQMPLDHPCDYPAPLGIRGQGSGVGGQAPAISDPRALETTTALDQITTVIRQFDDWLEEHRDDRDPWSSFGEFIRGALHQCCRATYVRPYRLHHEGVELAPLREPDPLGEEKRISARQGILGHVVTTGRSYVDGDRTQGALITQLAVDTAASAKREPGGGSTAAIYGPTGTTAEHTAGKTTAPTSETIVWCFAISRGTQRLGAVTVGQLDCGGGTPAEHLPLLRAVEQLVAQCWCLLAETVHGRTVGQDDPESGLHNRSAFLKLAQQSLRESYAQGEPVAIAVIALEGMRELNDAGRWEVADELVREVAYTMRRKVRMDDRLGRFDGSRFIWLLRRVDAELASLIVKQVMSRLTTVCGDRGRWCASITVRCGVVGSGMDNPDLRTLVSHALVQSRRARLEQVTVAGELDAVGELSASGHTSV